MIVYQRRKDEFVEDAFRRDIETIVLESMRRRLGRGVGEAEIRSWRESLTSMAKVLDDDAIPADAGVAIEYSIPQTSKRIDFIVSGRDDAGADRVVIVELKQWSSARRTDRDGIVEVDLRGPRELSHPSYQAWSYAALLEDFNEAVHGGGIGLSPCAYLHNYVPDGEIDHAFYATHLARAPVFLRGQSERERLRGFIARWVRRGDDGAALWRIDGGRIRPSRMLADSLAAMLAGKPEFVLVDDQKVVYEKALALARRAAATGRKQVLVVEGGPGTGKTVLAVSLLVELIRSDFVARYVSKNAAPRAVYESILTGSMRPTRFRNLFSGSGAFVGAQRDAWDALIVDEAHRLNEKSGLYRNQGDHQGREIVRAARCSVFFVDDDQRVTLLDVGEADAIRRWAAEEGAEVHTASLASQFRCNGSDGYLAWLDHVLQVRPTANTELDTADYDFRVFDSPAALHDAIEERNRLANRARVVAGYCWKWVSKRQPERFDIELPEHGYRRRWNLDRDGSLWLVAPDSVEQVGCIHTCQGLELDVVGVIVGPDLIVRDGRVLVRPERRASTDQSLRGVKKLAGTDAEAAWRRADRIVRNTYRTLMTRGMKGCWIWSDDAETAAWFRSRLVGRGNEAQQGPARLEPAPTPGRGQPAVPFPIVPSQGLHPWVNALPLAGARLVLGGQGADFDPAGATWIAPPEWIRPTPGSFVGRVARTGHGGDAAGWTWCLFRLAADGAARVARDAAAERIAPGRHGVSDARPAPFEVRVLDGRGAEPGVRTFAVGGEGGDEATFVAELVAVLR
jgi:DUF2075 family protein